MNAISDRNAVLAMIAVLVSRSASASDEANTVAAKSPPDTAQLSGDLTVTQVVQGTLPVGPDHRGAISFATGATPWWPKAAWIHMPRSEDIEHQVGQWLELQKIDASGDENCGLVGKASPARNDFWVRFLRLAWEILLRHAFERVMNATAEHHTSSIPPSLTVRQLMHTPTIPSVSFPYRQPGNCCASGSLGFAGDRCHRLFSITTSPRLAAVGLPG